MLTCFEFLPLLGPGLDSLLELSNHVTDALSFLKMIFEL